MLLCDILKIVVLILPQILIVNVLVTQHLRGLFARLPLRFAVSRFSLRILLRRILSTSVKTFCCFFGAFTASESVFFFLPSTLSVRGFLLNFDCLWSSFFRLPLLPAVLLGNSSEITQIVIQ